MLRNSSYILSGVLACTLLIVNIPKVSVQKVEATPAFVYNWLRVLCKSRCEILNGKVKLSFRGERTLGFESFQALFPKIPVSQARQIWVSRAKTSRRMDDAGVGSGRNAGD